MTNELEFMKFDSIKRLSRGCTITEKIDGTNAQVFITRSDSLPEGIVEKYIAPFLLVDGYLIAAGSRNRYVTKENDNYGFGRWVYENREELVKGLGEGRHFGEWWGQGIQRGYDRKGKTFSLFNTNRWTEETAPSCCSVVPHLYTGLFDTTIVDSQLRELEAEGSLASPGFMKPEGIVVYHHATHSLFKKTLDGNDGHKSEMK